MREALFVILVPLLGVAAGAFLALELATRF